jgi:hypothetical protein
MKTTRKTTSKKAVATAAKRHIATCYSCGWQGPADACAYLDDSGIGRDPVCPNCGADGIPVEFTDRPVRPPRPEQALTPGQKVWIHEGEFPYPVQVTEVIPAGAFRSTKQYACKLANGKVDYFPATDKRIGTTEPRWADYC